MAYLEHANITVADAHTTAAMLCDLFGWHIRWQGDSIYNGRSVHVGSADHYIALYTGPNGGRDQQPATDSYNQRAGLNHIGIVVDDLDAVEARVKAQGFETHSHADYAPGKRFYFDDPNGLEIEVVSYA